MSNELLQLIGVLGSAIIGAISALGVQFAKSMVEKHKHDKEMALHEQEQQYTLKDVQKRLDRVEAKLDEHNHYAARFSEIEKSIIRIDERQATILQQAKLITNGE